MQIRETITAKVDCLDRFINTPTPNKTAVIWEADSGAYKTLACYS
jgi:acyl-coenzyme A synthetase/AMP-(fatty) acid ligase